MMIWKSPSEAKEHERKKIDLVGLQNSENVFSTPATSGIKIVDASSIASISNTCNPASQAQKAKVEFQSSDEVSDSGIRIVETMSLAAAEYFTTQQTQNETDEHSKVANQAAEIDSAHAVMMDLIVRSFHEDTKSAELSQFSPVEEKTCSLNLKKERKNKISFREDLNDSIYISKALNLKRARWSNVDSKEANLSSKQRIAARDKPADREAVGLLQLNKDRLRGSTTQVILVRVHLKLIFNNSILFLTQSTERNTIRLIQGANPPAEVPTQLKRKRGRPLGSTKKMKKTIGVRNLVTIYKVKHTQTIFLEC